MTHDAPAMPVHAVTALALAVALSFGTTPLEAQNAGAYLAMKIDDAALPLADRVTDEEGTTYLVEFDRLVLSLRGGNRFRASIRYRRSLATSDRRVPSRAAPIQTLSVTGNYSIVGTEIRFAPDSSADARGVRMLTGTVTGPRRITLPFDYRNGAVQRRRVLELHRSDDIF